MSKFAKRSSCARLDNPSASSRRRRKRQQGFVLVTMAVATIAMMGVMGLAIDMGHLFIVKNETQAYVDAAAIAAALQLDGTSQGITDATSAASSMANKWNFSTTTVPTPTVEFSDSATGTWLASPAAPATMTY